MAERIQDILARHKAAQIDAGNSRGARILRNLQLAVARADARGAFTAELVVPVASQETLETKGLVIAESIALKGFFGKDIQVPQPPTELFKTLDAMEERGIARFEIHYLPGVELSPEGKLPGWKVKPELWFWQQIKDGGIAKDAANLRAGWYLVDGRGKPNYGYGRQRYEDDGWFQTTIDELRASNRIQKFSDVVSGSRFGVSANEVEQVILPEFAKSLKTTGLVRTPREIEFNVLGNIHHPEWGNTNTWELMNDKFELDGRLFGGYSVSGGLASVSYGWVLHRDGFMAFRSLVEFSPKPQ